MGNYVQNKDINDSQNKENNESEYDHRRIGKELELFSFHEEGPGMPFFLPRGLAIRNQLIDFWRQEHQKANYQEIQSPILLDRKLWEKSGHWQLYKENMYVSEVDKRVFAIKPMNCPGAILHYQERKRHLNELPFRICEMGQVHREEKSGAMHGLLRVRSFVVDDAHIFCAKDQLLDEIKLVLKLSLHILKACGFDDYVFELSVRSDDKKQKYLGDDHDWIYAEEVLQQALEECGHSYQRMYGEAKFYGPAIDLKIKDSAGRLWQCSSLQMDFNLGQRFQLSYFDENGKKKSPYILHRCIYGSLERFMGVLLEHHRGELPMWLAPVQCRLVSISKAGEASLQKLSSWLREKGARVEHDFKEDHLSEKIKRSQRWKVPLLILSGDKEAAEGKFSLRLKSGKQLIGLSEEELLQHIRNP